MSLDGCEHDFEYDWAEGVRRCQWCTYSEKLIKRTPFGVQIDLPEIVDDEDRPFVEGPSFEPGVHGKAYSYPGNWGWSGHHASK